MLRPLFFFCAMGCIGMTMEIFFTAIYGIVQETAEVPVRLMGHSYIWMFPIYGLAGIIFPPVLKIIGHWNILLRMCVYAIGILAVEFATGWFLDLVTGQCPWEYKEGLHIMGYMRIDYFPFWAVFGLLVELVLKFLMSLQRVPDV